MDRISQQQRSTLARWLRWLGPFAAILFMVLGLRVQAQVDSTYELVHDAPFNQPNYYPIAQTVPRDRYQPVGEWVGRLILPSLAEVETGREQSPDWVDWVWFEVQAAPAEESSWVGQRLRLTWADDPIVQAAVKLLTQPVEFTAATQASQRAGILHPQRLEGRDNVGPLQSLAGARPDDNVLVRLEQVTLSPQTSVGNRSDNPVLRITQEPIQVGGRFYGLVSILGPATDSSDLSDAAAKQLADGASTSACGESADCEADRFRVRHFNPDSRQFDGPLEIVRIPQQPPAPNGIPQSTANGLANSPAGKAGWYIYGAPDQEGTFTVQAIAPRSLFQLQPDRTILNQADAQRYIRVENWQHPERRKGAVDRVLLDPAAHNEQAAIAAWQTGDRALVVHLFGGIGGEQAEPTTLGTVTGHFAYGRARVVREPLADELQFAIEYQQVYAHNPHGIVAGTSDWSAYMGSLRYGWLGTRPVSDVLIKLPAVTQPYEFGDAVLWPLRQLMSQLSVMMARYRIGDGTGNASVTPASSCVQDSNQALYAAIQSVENTVTQSPTIQQWLQQHPDAPQTQRFQTLVALGRQLERELVPLGIVRADWNRNAETLAGIQAQPATWEERLINRNALLTALLSWRTLLPRRAHDEISRIALEQGGQLWFLRTNQVGGEIPTIQPLAPTRLLGRFPAIATLISRISLALLTIPRLTSWLWSAAILALYGAIAVPIGLHQGFLQLRIGLSAGVHRWRAARMVLSAFVAPALVEELVFRVLLLPHPTSHLPVWQWWGWALGGIALFVAYHPLNGLTFYRTGLPTFLNPTFLILAALLGLACSGVYCLSGSLWPPLLLHWAVVSVWLIGLGGYGHFHDAPANNSLSG